MERNEERMAIYFKRQILSYLRTKESTKQILLKKKADSLYSKEWNISKYKHLSVGPSFMLLGVGILIYTLWVTLKPVFPVEDIDHLMVNFQFNLEEKRNPWNQII